MGFFEIMNLFGGVAFFLFGMHIMGRGLTRLAGNKLQLLLKKLTANRFKALMLGLVVTVIIQSSSATTVMVVGLVNSNLMGLFQGAFVNMGADIGTTITAWILSLSSVGDGHNARDIMRLVNPLSYLPILAVIGVVLVVFIRNTRRYNIGMILLGFVIILEGMDTMKHAVAPLQNSNVFENFITTISNPLLALFFGLVMTLIIQSSSASIGILQALAITGLINYQVALPIIVGCNIGTCITALISAISASVSGKRVAVANLLFKVFGAVFIAGGFYLVNFFMNFDFLPLVITPVGIAIAHTSFNVINAVIQFPLIKYLCQFVSWLIPEKATNIEVVTDEYNDLKALDDRFLNTPAFAVEQSLQTTLKMAKYAAQSYHLAIGLLHEFDDNIFAQVKKIEAITDQYEDILGKYTLRLSSHRMSDDDNNRLTMVMHCISYFEKIGDRALLVANAAKEMHEKELTFSKEAQKEISILDRAIKLILADTIQVFAEQDVQGALSIQPLEEVIDYLNYKIKNRHIRRLQAGVCTIELGFIMGDITTALERIADHCSAVSMTMIEMENNELGSHAAASEIKVDNRKFQQLYDNYKEQFKLPQMLDLK